MQQNYLAGKVLISGTGRCGTSLLMRILTAAGEDTGYAHHSDSILPEVQAGMERIADPSAPGWHLNNFPRWSKDPRLCLTLGPLAEKGQVPEHLVVCVRDVDQSAKSLIEARRPWFPSYDGPEFHKDPRHAWPKFATWENQASVLRMLLGSLVESAVLHGIPMTFIPYDSMADHEDLFWRLALRVGLDCNLRTFKDAHREVYDVNLRKVR